MADNKFTLDLSGRRTRKIDEQLDQIRTEDRQNRANDARDEYIRAQLQEIALQDIYDRRQREYDNNQKLQAAADNEYWSGRRFGLRPNADRNALVNPAPASRFDPGWLAAPSVRDAQEEAVRQQDLAAEALAARGGGTLLSNEELERQAAQYTANANRANAAAENLQRQRIELGRVAGQARTYGYEKNRNAPDFADLSRYQTTATGEGREVRDLDYNTGKTTGGTHREYEYGDLAYDFINQNRDAAAQWSYNAVRNNAGLLGMDNRELRQMTPDEIAMFNYLYAKDSQLGDQDHKNAYDYIRFIQSDPLYASGDGTLNARQRAEETKQAAAFAQAHPVAASAGTVLANPLKAITYLSQAADFIDDGKMETDAGYNRYSYIPSAIRDAVSKEVEQKWSAKGKFAGKAATFAYQTGMSMADFLFNTAITGGFAGGGVASEAFALSLMGTEAAADATLAAKDRGLDDAQAFAIGTIAGAAEIITEKFSIEALLNNVGRAGLSYWLKNAFTEGAEEIGSDFINLMADILIAKDKGEWQAAIDAYVSKGYTKEEAFGKALGDQAAQMGVSFLGGALSGGVMGGAGAVRIGFLNSAQGADYRAEARQNGTEMEALRALAEAGLQSGDAETARLAQNMQGRLDAGKRIPDRAVGRLAYELDETLGDTEDEEPAAGPSFRQELNRPRSIEEYAARQTGRPYTRYANENFEEAFRTAETPAAEARPTLRSLNTDQIDRAAASFGKEGGAALRANYNSEVSPSEYFRDFSRFYNAGITGRSTETMDMGVLTPEQRVAAYEAGAKDQTATAKATASANVGFHDSTGLVGRFTSAVLDKLAKLTRTSIEIDPNVDDLVNGQIIGNRIILQKASDFELIKTAKHEITHRLQELAPEAYKTYRDFALNTLAENGDVDALVRRYQQDYKRVGQNLSPAQAMDEIAADFTEALVTEAENGSTETFAKLAAHDAKAANGFVRAIRDFISRVKRAFSGRQADEVSRNTFGVGLDKLEQAAKLWDDLLNEGEQAAQGLGVEANENAASEETAGKFSTKAEVLALQGVDWVGNKTSIKEQLRLHADELNAMDPVAVVEYIHKPKESIIDLMMGVLPYFGGGAIKNSGVSFNFDLEGAKSINGHATGAELRAAALSAPYVAKRGRLIAGQKNHENTGLTTLTFGAPVIINNVRVNVGVVVQFESNGRPRAVNVGLQSGKRFRIEELKAPRGTSSRVTRYSGQGTSLDTRDAFDKKVTHPGEEVKKYSLKSVPAVKSTSDEWAPGLTEADVRAAYPNLYGTPYDFVQNLQEAQRANENAGWSDDASRGHPTQRANTIASYKKMLSMVEDKSASILDASSGLGMGTQYGRQQGYDVDDIEPYAGEGYTPRYTDYSKLHKKYDYVFSNAVLNVLPQDQRDSMVWHIANALKPGGKAFIAVRNAAAIRAIKSGVVLGNDTAEVVVPGTGASSYQKGFTPDELQAYLQDAVGDGYTVEKVTGKDRFGDVCAVITKNGARYSLKDTDLRETDTAYLSAVKSGDMETAQRMVDEAAKAAGYTRRAFHQTSAKNITVFDLSIGTNGGTDSETPYGVFTKRTNADIGLGDVQMSLYVRPGKTLRFKNREELHRYFGGEYKAILDEIDAINNRYDKLYEAASDEAAELQDKWLDAHPEIDTMSMPVEEFLKGDFYTGKEVRAAMDKADSIMSRWTDSVNELSIKAKEVLTEMLKAEGYDSVEILVDSGSGGRKTDTFISLDNRAVKSADPVTYDDDGNVIPLSERFNQENPDIRYSLKPVQSVSGVAYDTPAPAYDGSDTAVIDADNGTRYSLKSAREDLNDFNWDTFSKGKMYKDMRTIMSDKDIHALFDGIKDLVEYMIPNRDILDMNEAANKGDRKFKPYKPNSDPLYKVSLDFSTLCRKRLMTQFVIGQLQLRENRALTAEEQLTVRNMLIDYRAQDKALQVACAMCYVEAARLKSPKFTNAYLENPEPVIVDYLAKKSKRFAAEIKNRQADFKEAHGYARNAAKKDMSAADVKELNRLTPQWRQEYTPSAEEQKIVELAKTLPNSTYLTPENLANLAAGSPEEQTIHAAYTNYIREMTHSKALETGVAYYYGDSKKVSAKRLAGFNAENGLRFDSWSDFQFEHMLDMMMAVIDLSTRKVGNSRGAKMHGYTKFPEMVRIFGRTNMMFNLSGVSEGDGFNEDGSLRFSKSESIDYDEAIAVRDAFPETAGLQCIGINDRHILALMASDLIDYIIPYHRSGMNALLRKMAGIDGWTDYEGMQEASIDKSIQFDPEKHDEKTWHKEPVFSEFFVGYNTGMTGIEAMRASAEAYKRMCAERGMKPKFEKFSDNENYWKLLIDRKMINQKTGALIEQKAVRPVFDFYAIKTEIDKYVANYDPELQNRALDYITENWQADPVEQASVLGNEMLAAQQDGVEGARNSLRNSPLETMQQAEAAQRALERENNDLRERVAYWKGQTRRSTGVKTNPAEVKRAARRIARYYSSDADITAELQELYDWIANGGQDVSGEEANRRARAIADKVVDSALETEAAQYDMYGDLRDYLRRTELSISPEDRANIQDYNDWRKQYFGRMNLKGGSTNIDSVYMEMSELWPELFPDSITHPADQLLQIAEVADQIYTVTEHNPFAGYEDEAAVGIANEILETFFDLPQVRPTFADYQARKLAAEKAKGAEKLRALRAQKNEQIERITRTERDKRTEQADRLRRQRDEAIAKLREQNRETVRRALERSMETRERQLNALKDRYARSQAKSRDARSAREMRGKILRHSRALSEKLMRPTDKAHIPEVLQKPVAELLAAINQESLYSIDRNGKRVRNDSGDPTKRTQAFRALKERYEQILKPPVKFEGVIDPDLMDNLTDVIAMKDVKLAEMSLSQLDTVWKTLKGVEASVNTWNKTFAAARFATVSEAAEAIREENADKQERTQLRGFLGSAQTLTGVDMMTPEAYFHRLGKPGDALFREMRNAQDKQITILKAVSDYTTDALKGTDARKLEQEMHTVTLGGESVQMSTAQLMELYVLMRREQARQHILVGGILPEAVNTRGLKKVSRAEPVCGITVEEIAEATSKLTAKQRAVAEALQSYASTELSRYGNEASMQVYGYKKFGEEFYWPIRSNRQEVKTEIGKDIQAPTVSNKGMTKLTVPNANNSVMIGSIFDTFTQHSTEMATYAAWLAATEDVNRVRNFTFRDDADGAPVRTRSVKGILDRVYGSGGSEYLGKLLADIANGVNNGDAGLFDQFTGNYKASAVGANLRVIIQQPTAILRALDMIDLKYMTSGLAANPLRGWRKATEFAPIAQWKDWGYFDVSTGRSMKDVMFQATSRLEKARNAMMAPAGWADSVSWGYLWNAVEREIRATTDLTGAEFDRAVAARFTEIVDRTQVVDGILQRSQIMRKGGINKMATAFMAEPTKQYNMLLTSAYDARHSSGAAKRAAKIRLARTAAALLASGVVNAAAQAIIDALRDSDREKDYWEKWMDAFVGKADEQEKFGKKLQQIFLEGNLGSQFMPLNYIPYIKDFVSLIQGYDVGRMDMESISSFIKAALNLNKALNGEGKLTTAGALANIFGEASRMLGIPAANARRDAEALAAAIIYSSGNYVAEYRYEKWAKRQSSNRNTFYDILYNAYKDDFKAFNIIYNDMLAGGEFVTSDKSAAEAIASAMESRMKEDAGVSSVKDLANRFTPDMQVEIAAVPNAESAVPDEAQQKEAEAEKEQSKEAVREADRKAAEARANAAIENNIVLTPTRIAYNEHVEKIQDSALWPVSGLDDREEILELIDEMTSGSGDRGKGALKTVAAGADVGMTEDLYLLYDLAWHMADKANDGNGSLKQSEFIEAMKNVDMTPEQRTFLWNRKWKPGKMPDWTKPKNQW